MAGRGVLHPTPSHSPPAAREMATVSGASSAASGRAGTVVVVDADPMVRELSALALERVGGFRVAALCHDAASAIAAVAEARPDVVLVDVRLPGLHGTAVLEALLEVSPRTRVVAMVGHGSSTSRRRLVEAGAWDVVWKGLGAASLTSRVVAVSQANGERPPPERPAPELPARDVGAERSEPAVTAPTEPGPGRAGWSDSPGGGRLTAPIPSNWVVRDPGPAILAGWLGAAAVAVACAVGLSWWLAGGRTSALMQGLALPLGTAICLTSGAVLAARAWQRTVRVTARLAEVHEELGGLHRQQQEFVAIASHELRTPVTVVAGFASTLDGRWDDLEPDVRRSMAARIARNAGRMSRLVEDLMTATLTNRGGLQLVPQPVLVSELLDDVVEGGPLRHGEVEVMCEEGLLVRVDATHGPRIVANLLDNAARHGRSPVRVAARSRGDQVEILVEDSGDGVPASFVADLFVPFRQADGHHRRRAGGIGLGLYTSAQLAWMSGGRLRHERPDAGGARFVLVLPRATDSGGVA